MFRAMWPNRGKGWEIACALDEGHSSMVIGEPEECDRWPRLKRSPPSACPACRHTNWCGCRCILVEYV